MGGQSPGGATEGVSLQRFLSPLPGLSLIGGIPGGCALRACPPFHGIEPGYSLSPLRGSTPVISQLHGAAARKPGYSRRPALREARLDFRVSKARSSRTSGAVDGCLKFQPPPGTRPVRGVTGSSVDSVGGWACPGSDLVSAIEIGGDYEIAQYRHDRLWIHGASAFQRL